MWPNVYKETLFKLHIKNEIMFLINEEKFFESWISFLYIINVLSFDLYSMYFSGLLKGTMAVLPWPTNSSRES